MKEKTFTISYFFDEEAGVWVGINHDLPVAVEGESYDALVKNVWAAASDMAQGNRHVEDLKNMKLHFHAEMNSPTHCGAV